jgi:hypothetical protein
MLYADLHAFIYIHLEHKLLNIYQGEKYLDQSCG